MTEFCHVQNSLCIQLLRSPAVAALLHGNGVGRVSQTLRHGTKMELEMWANAQRDRSPAEYMWRPLLNAAKFG